MNESPRRRTADALRAVDGLVHTHLQQGPVDTRVLANIAVAMATEYSNAARGTLLLDDGHGLEPSFALGPGLTAAEPDTDSFDRELVERAAKLRRLVRVGGQIAAPILLGGGVRGAIFLAAGELDELSDDAEELAAAVASRIATLLHSARLVEENARRDSGVESLEALGRALSSGPLGDAELSRAVDAAIQATASRNAVFGLLDDAGTLLDLHVRGDQLTLGAVAREIARAIASGDAAGAADRLGSPHLLETLSAEILAGPQAARPHGFLAVSRPGGPPYTASECSLFRALAHLVAGALLRLAYFRRASEDTLTRTGSRMGLEFAFAQAIFDAMTSGRLAVALIDIDSFKQTNDTHGHLVGDQLLVGVAELLRQRLRATDFVARYGGDEFIVLLPETDREEALEVAEQLRALVAETPLTDAGLSVSLSIGVSQFPADGRNAKDLVSAADRALYESKRAGRNRVTGAAPNPEPTDSQR